ncbi:MAG: MarR family winged helix-turn-helix transcriptional regulator [Solirubrobacteraceae bacterium]
MARERQRAKSASVARERAGESEAESDATVEEQVQAARDQWPQIDPEVEAVVMRLDRADRYILKAATVSLARAGLGYQEFKILKLLLGGPRSHGSLCRELLVSSGVMTNRLDKLEDAELLERMSDPHDRRGVLLEITGDGRERLDAYIDLGAKREQELFEVLDEDEMQQLNALLAKLLGAWRSELGPAPRRRLASEAP